MKISYISLGCPKNYIDLETILGNLGQEIQIVDDPDASDATIVNTCAFITGAKEEAIEEILSIAKVKKRHRQHKILVTGCLPQRYHEVLKKELPEVDAFFDSCDPAKTSEEIRKLLQINHFYPGKRKLITPSHYAYLKIAEGCDNRCSYCAIPLIKGPYKSIDKKEILAEAKFLVEEKGVKELILVAQDTTNYGHDLQVNFDLPDLLHELNELRSLRWLRLMYTHPARWNEPLIEAMAECERLVKYIDLPVQHINDRILKKMGRNTNRTQIENLIGKLREKIPGLFLRTSLIVGFPGETEREYKELLSFVEEIRFERLGVFTYSKEEDTKAFEFRDNVGDDIKEARQAEILDLHASISREKNEALLGKTIDILIDEAIESENQSIGRSPGDAPEIDHIVVISSRHAPGEFIQVKIDQALPFELYGNVK